MKIHNIPIKKCVFQLCFLIFICCGYILKAQFYQSSILTDSSIYKLGSEWTFSYQFIPGTSKNAINADDLKKIKNVVITVLKIPEDIRKKRNLDSTQNLLFEYKYPPQGTSSQSSIIEDDKAVWVHPPRDYFFKILQINPYPYIKKPFKKGLKWTWELPIGDYWADERWRKWTGVITTISTYKIEGDTLLNTKLGKVKCYIVQSSAKSELGITYLTSYFNPVFGFVKLDYTNIDGSKIILDLVACIPRNFFLTQ